MDPAARRRYHVEIILSAYISVVSLFLMTSDRVAAVDGSAWAHSWVMDVDLSGVDASFQGEIATDQFSGDNVAIIPDVNGDGISDLLIAAAGNDDAGSGAGKVYLFFGKTSGWSRDVVVSTSTADASFVGEAASDQLLISGSLGSGSKRFGDLNGDGLGDIVVTARQNDESASQAGQVYVIFGRTSGWDDRMNLGTSANASFLGKNASSFMGTQVSALGDVNGDNLNDFIICSSLDDDAGTNKGQCNLIFGKTSGWAMDQNIGTEGVVSASINGTDAEEWFGYVSGIGDVNADGYDDFAVGAVKDDDAGTDRGQVYVFFGKSSGWTTSSSAYALADASYVGEADSDQLGLVVGALGDVNGDSIDDFGFSNTNSTGEVYVVFGKTSGWSKGVSADNVDASFYSEESGDVFGVSMDGGDLNNDGYSDIVIGAYFNNGGNPTEGATDGQVYVVFGRSTGWSTSTIITAMASSSFWGEELADFAGGDVSVGDMNNDNAADILIGALGNDENGSMTGQAYVVLAQTPPSVSISSAGQITDGTGVVSVTTTVSDTNSFSQAMRVRYRLGTNCASSTSAATLGSTVVATYNDSGGSPTVSNSTAFQAGYETNKKIITSSGTNTVNVRWNSQTDVPTGNATYCVAVTVTDGAAYSEVASTTLVIDNVVPANPGSLSGVTTTATSFKMTFGSASTDTNFQEYKILYATTTPVSTSSSYLSFTSSSDSNLGSRTYNSATSSTVTSLTPNTSYYFNIFAYDQYGNTSKAVSEVSTTTHATVPTLSLTSDAQDRITVSWSGNPSSTEMYVENITLGTNSDWITSDTWTSDSLLCDTKYFFRAKARGTTGVESAFSDSTSLYAHGCQSGGGGAGGGGGGATAPASESPPVLAPSSTEPQVVIPPFTMDTPKNAAIIAELPFDVTGAAPPGTRVTVEIAGSKYSVETDADGTYRVTVLDDLAPGDYTITASEPEDKGGRNVSRTITYAPVTKGAVDTATTDNPKTTPEVSAPVAKEESGKILPPRGGVPPKAEALAPPAFAPAPVTSGAVAEAVTTAEQRKAFLLVLKKTTAQFREAQIGPVDVVAGETITVLTRPSEPVYSITARLYPKSPEGRPQTYDDWVAGYLVAPTKNGDAYRGEMTIPALAKGEYVLRVTMNGDQSERSTIEKEIHVLAKGAVVKENATRIPRAQVTIYAQLPDGEFREWNAAQFGAENPVWSDSSGAYAFSLPAGAYYVSVFADGFEPYQSGVTILKAPGIYRDVIRLLPKKSSGFFQTIFGKLK